MRENEEEEEGTVFEGERFKLILATELTKKDYLLLS